MNGDPDQLISRMSSLSDPARLRVMHLLERQAMLVNDLAEVLQLPQSTVSRHLKQLSEQGWLVSHREGTSHQYRMLVDELDDRARALWTLTRSQTLEWSAVTQDRLRLSAVLATRQRDSRSFFAGAAGDWDRIRAEYFGTQFSVAGLLALLDPSLVVADLGCGTGALLEQLSPCCRRVIGIDNSDDMLAAARQRVEKLTNVDLRQGDLSAIPIDDASVDATLCVLTLSYVTDVATALMQVRRVLKPGGRAVIVDVLPHHRDDFRRQMGQTRMGFSEVELTSLLRHAGFPIVHFRSLPPETQAKGPALFCATAR
jgi:ArsR family transcriptional regulator